ncbi:AraC family transcriptional regulator [Agrobacterium tumefaciens]|uniref:AraC family transcriptional regulator n=1 Tax=Agrobacterium tumefaciens TaxID=358 RepID=UPI00287E2687|nr:AraC family transcriptional regulator [Agrobacterium tumefaciens]MDS7593886.1 AraC family transcriptional regulator [Agrobacterium tumefaciens]
MAEDAFLLSVQLRDYFGDLWVDGRRVEFQSFRKGNFSLYDYNRSWQANLRSAFDCVNFHIPRAALDALEEDHGTRRIETLNVMPGADVNDPTIRGLVEALLPAFANPAQASRLFVDHVGLALATHMATTYGEARSLPLMHPGALAPWQLKRAKAVIDARLDGDLPVAELARECGLSPSYFTRAFKASTGMPPYQWMMRRRVDKAMELLKGGHLPLSQVAGICGFVDQSHMTRVFTRTVGIPPGSWRRAGRDDGNASEN